MLVLVACEKSGRVRDAFIKKGHLAISADISPSDVPGPHYLLSETCLAEIVKGYAIGVPWDLIIAFPPCTDLAASGAQYWPQKQKDGRQQKAIGFFMMLANAPCRRIAIENPTGIIPKVWRKYDQIIQPWMFGEPYNKRTCLWLKGLPLLQPTDIVEPEFNWCSSLYRGGERTKSKLKSLHRSPEKRSLTFQGIANAMAAQWG